MSRILLDQSAPKGLRQLLTGHDVKTAYEMGWDKIANGKLLAAAEAAGFAIIVSADQSIWRQQNIAGRKIALIVTTTNHWDTIKANPAGVNRGVRRGRAGAHHRRSVSKATASPPADVSALVPIKPARCLKWPAAP